MACYSHRSEGSRERVDSAYSDKDRACSVYSDVSSEESCTGDEEATVHESVVAVDSSRESYLAALAASAEITSDRANGTSCDESSEARHSSASSESSITRTSSSVTSESMAATAASFASNNSKS